MQNIPIRVWLAELARGVTIALSIAVVISFCAVGCMMNKRDHATQRVIHLKPVHLAGGSHGT